MTINHRGKKFTLDHLNKYEVRTKVTLKKGNVKEVHTEILFSSHCYTRAVMDGDEKDKAYLLVEGGKYDTRERIFCEIRYKASLKLRSIMERILNNDEEVSLSSRSNIFNVEILSNNYTIFFKVKKKQDFNRPKKIQIYIESAYHLPDTPKPKKIRPISVFLGYIWENKKL